MCVANEKGEEFSCKSTAFVNYLGSWEHKVRGWSEYAEQRYGNSGDLMRKLFAQRSEVFVRVSDEAEVTPFMFIFRCLFSFH